MPFKKFHVLLPKNGFWIRHELYGSQEIHGLPSCTSDTYDPLRHKQKDKHTEMCPTHQRKQCIWVVPKSFWHSKWEGRDFYHSSPEISVKPQKLALVKC